MRRCGAESAALSLVADALVAEVVRNHRFEPKPRRRIEAAVESSDSADAPVTHEAKRNCATQRTSRFFSAMRRPNGKLR